MDAQNFQLEEVVITVAVGLALQELDLSVSALQEGPFEKGR
jgi:hypothetical protein